MARWKKLLVAAAGVLALFAIVGFFVAPPLVKSRLLRELSKRLGREVTVGAVSVNPFELSVSVRDLRIQDKDGKPFASWNRAYANYRFTSFFSRDYSFDEVTFESPYARFVINEDGTLNIEDLLRIFRASPAEAATGPPAAWTFAAVRVSGARVGFTDRQRDPDFETTVGPFELNLDAFSTSPNSEAPYGFEGRTESGETFSWKGRITSNPLKSSGELMLGGVTLPKYRTYYQTGRPFNVREGKVTLSAAYDLVWTETEKVLRVRGANLALDNAVIGRPGIEEPDIRVDSLKVVNADVDGLTYEAKIERIALEGGHVLLRHDPAHGGVNLHQMIRPFIEGPPNTPPPATPPATPAPLSVGTLSISGVEVEAEDLAPTRAFKVAAHDVALTVTGIDNKPGTVCPATLTARFGDSGTVKAAGSFSADFHHGDLDVDVDGVDMRATDSYVDPYARVRVASGSIGAKGHVRFELPDEGDMGFAYTGDFRLRDLAIVHADTAQDLMRLAVFQISPLEVTLNPTSVAIGEMAIAAPQLKVGVAPDRSIDLMSVLVSSPETATSSKPSERPAPSPRVTIDTVRVQNGSIRITDRSVEPNVTLSIARLSGTVKGVSTDELARANVDFSAMIDGVAPVAIKGQINPVARKDFTDLTVAAKGIDLLPFSPYSGKYLGYGIGKGKMAADLAYRISERRFTSNNLFTIDQFELGSKVESPDAVRLPMKLAVAVLRDRNGQIVLDVPAEGSVDDPEFRLGRVIVRAIVNVLTKIVTSPFRLLAGAFGGGKDQNIEYQDFAPGSAELSDAERQKLDVVAKSLQERPELSLDVQGSVEPVADAAALTKARLDVLVRAAKWKVVSAGNPALAAPESVTVGPEEYPRWLQAAYDNAFPPSSVLPPPPTTDEMETKLAGTITITADDLRALADERSKAVRDYLTRNGQVAAERVFMTDAVAKEGRDPASRVWLELK